MSDPKERLLQTLVSTSVLCLCSTKITFLNPWSFVFKQETFFSAFGNTQLEFQGAELMLGQVDNRLTIRSRRRRSGRFCVSIWKSKFHAAAAGGMWQLHKVNCYFVAAIQFPAEEKGRTDRESRNELVNGVTQFGIWRAGRGGRAHQQIGDFIAISELHSPHTLPRTTVEHILACYS